MEAAVETPVKHAGGRIPEITEERLKRLAACRIMDMDKVRTASFLGVSRQTYYYWIEKAVKVQELVDSGQEGLLTENDKLYLKFSYIYNNATTELMAGCLAELRAHGRQHWQALTWILTHLDPEKWASFENQPIKKTSADILKPSVSEEHKEFDPYEPERIARLIISYREAGLIPQEIIDSIIERGGGGRGTNGGIPENAPDEISSGNGKP